VKYYFLKQILISDEDEFINISFPEKNIIKTISRLEIVQLRTCQQQQSTPQQ